MSEILHTIAHRKEPDAATLISEYRRVRERTETLCAPLAVEDYGVQPMADASPPKWHLAHTSWFFETFLLRPQGSYIPFHPRYEYLFNSYYNSVGVQFPRASRGHLSRPTVAEIMDYRRHVDSAMMGLLESAAVDSYAVCLGLNHEQQHQELILTDVKYNLGRNPLFPPYREDLPNPEPGVIEPLSFVEFEAADVEIGARLEAFSFDNEHPRHRVHTHAFGLADRLITNEEFLGFIEDDGYRRPELWLSDAWAALTEGACRSPLYWVREDGTWHEYGLGGLRPLSGTQPVVHVSFYEADAFARWSGARLPTEFEWERAAADAPRHGNFADADVLAPRAARGTGLRQLFGDAWEWTGSSYAPYPGYRPGAGAFGEYNGKFMSSQMVLRGGSCATPEGHVRATYRNFFYPGDQWQFSGIRLARDPE